MAPQEDVHLIGQALAGRSDAYGDLVRKYHAQILSLCRSLLGDPAEGDDAAQEVFVKAYRSLADFRQDALFSTWLHRIATNHCLDVMRKRSRARSESWDELARTRAEPLRRLFAEDDDPARSEEHRDLAERILSRLPEDYRAVLTLRELQGLSYREIAQAMNCSVDSVKARLRRARQELTAWTRHFFAPENV